MNMTTESSTYTYEDGGQETVTLKHGTADPHGHALLRIKHDDGETLDCYVNTAWLRDRANDLDPRPLTPDADEGTSVDYHAMWWKAEREREKAERERDEARADAESLSRQLYDAQQDADMSRAELEGEPRPLTPDAITDEMVERARNAPSFDGRLSPTPRLVREMLTAALTEPPARPEGAEKIEKVLHRYWSGDIDGDDLADRIAEEMNR